MTERKRKVTHPTRDVTVTIPEPKGFKFDRFGEPNSDGTDWYFNGMQMALFVPTISPYGLSPRMIYKKVIDAPKKFPFPVGMAKGTIITIDSSMIVEIWPKGSNPTSHTTTWIGHNVSNSSSFFAEDFTEIFGIDVIGWYRGEDWKSYKWVKG